ncbi:MAG: hypothetical protein RL160_1470 [Bacteroidota bacterium]
MMDFIGVVHNVNYVRTRETIKKRLEKKCINTCCLPWFCCQLGFCFKNQWELASRYLVLNPDRQIWSTKDGFQQRQYVVGVSKYLNKHRVKCQIDLTWDEQFNQANRVKKNGPLIWRFQVELGI